VWDALVAHIARRGGNTAAVGLSHGGGGGGDGSGAPTSACRGLATACPVAKGGLLIRLPWAMALTPAEGFRAARTLLRPAARARLAALLRSGEGEGGGEGNGHHCLLPPGSAPVLLLALGLLADFRDRTASGPRGPYARLLPVPPGSRLAATAPGGPAATDLLLFSQADLAALGAPALAAAVRGEAVRLAALHAALFVEEGDDAEPPVSLPSFVWAHALARSRALDLGRRGDTAADDDADPATPASSSSLVMLPAIDLAQHDADRGGSAALFVRHASSGDEEEPSSSSSSPPLAVDLVARRPYPAPGAPVCLDYGRRALRDLLRTYAFVPPPADGGGPGGEADVFEDWVGEAGGEGDAAAAGLEALIIDAALPCSTSSPPPPAWLVEVRVLGAPGADPALLGGTARLAWVVRAHPPPAGGAPRIAVHGWGEGGEGGAGDPTGRALTMAPEAEAAAAGRVAGACEALAARLRDGADTVALAGTDASRDEWFVAEHARLAREYRAARVALLEWAAMGLRDQAAGWLK